MSSFDSTDYTFGQNTTTGPPGSAYQIVQELPTPGTSLIGTLFYVESVPGNLWILRVNVQGQLVYTKFGGRALRMKMCSADFTPFGVGTDPGGLSIVPYDPAEPGLVSIAWTVVDIVFRVETAALSGSTEVQIQRSTGTGAFSNVGVLNTTPVTIAAGNYEPTVRPAVITQTIVNSGDKLMPTYPSLGLGASGFSLYCVIRESDNP